MNSGGAILISICAVKLLRGAYGDTARQYPILAFTALFFKYDYTAGSETYLNDYFVIHYFIMTILLTKVCDFLLHFVDLLYISAIPWNHTVVQTVALKWWCYSGIYFILCLCVLTLEVHCKVLIMTKFSSPDPWVTAEAISIMHFINMMIIIFYIFL